MLFFVACFSGILVKLFYWQVLDRRNLISLANSQYLTSLKTPAPRGTILSKDRFPLVQNQSSFLLYANPQEIKTPETELKEKLKIVLADEQLNEISIFDKKLLWLPLVKNLSEETKNKIEELKIPGLGFEEKEERFYPEASMSAHLLGFVGKDEKGNPKGYFGLEGYYDKEIQGKEGKRFFEQDTLGRPIPLTEEIVENPIPGRNLLSSLDRPLQFLVEKRLQEGIKKYGASSGLVLIVNPQDGSVLSMASFPNFDPATYYSFDPSLYNNPIISSSFEPGSIFKVIVMAAAIDSGRVKMTETCSACEGPRTISDYSIKTWNEKYYPNSSMTDIIVHSDNVGMVYVGQKLGVEKLYEYLKSFGFDEKTNIDLQGEINPVLRAKADWREIDLATVSFGQGIAVTPIQMLMAVSAIANKGELYQPRVVEKIFEERKEILIKPIKKRRVISAETAQVISEMMVQSVEKGEAKWTRTKGYKIAGKTGTAQIPIKGHYDPEKTIASFVGFAPADNAQFAMMVALKEPKTSPWGSETAAPLWFEIADDIFRLWRIPIDS